MIDRYGEVLAYIRDGGAPNCGLISRAIKCRYNDAAAYMERMVAEGFVSEPNKDGQRSILRMPA